MHTIPDMTITRKLSVGIIGLGQFGVHFVELYQRHPNVGRLALCDIVPERVAACAKRFGVSETYDSLDAICNSDVDALAIITQRCRPSPRAEASSATRRWSRLWMNSSSRRR